MQARRDAVVELAQARGNALRGGQDLFCCFDRNAPRGVNENGRLLRSISGAPSEVSRPRMICETAGCVIWSCCAAAAMLPVLQARTKALSERRSKPHDVFMRVQAEHPASSCLLPSENPSKNFTYSAPKDSLGWQLHFGLPQVATFCRAIVNSNGLSWACGDDRVPRRGPLPLIGRDLIASHITVPGANPLYLKPRVIDSRRSRKTTV
jgi:hypothetical protein